ncbi:hypothetical protein GOV05_05320 [Candidatus Woesearchaeota archaeon]|nr:hypothetical protein [Candidatus Woesearchaeota archaeon]
MVMELVQPIFLTIGVIIIIATIFGYLARGFRQPLIPAYILAGILINLFAINFNIPLDHELILNLSEIGIAFLLFTVGLELDLKKLRDIGSVATIGGLIQFMVLFGLGFFIASILGYIPLEAVYLALIVVFSSTMVVIKILSDKKELDSLHGRIIIGLLLMQDILAIFCISILSSINDFSFFNLLFSLLKGFFLISLAFFSSKIFFPRIFKEAAKLPEILFLLSVSVAFLFSIAFGLMGFSISIGAFIAGVSLANLPYNLEIASRVKPVKDFFATLFFVSLGLQLIFDELVLLTVPIIVFVVFTIVVKSVFNFVLVLLFGYEKRTSFLTALGLSQVSEFGLIIVTSGVILGHVSQEFLGLAIIIATITITTSSYFIKFDKGIYNHTKGFLNIFNFLVSNKHVLRNFREDDEYNVLLIGYDRIGYNIYKGLTQISPKILVVDFNPDIIRRLMRRDVLCMYGDIGDSEILERINFSKLRMVISTIPEVRENLMLVKKVKKANFYTPIFVTSYNVDDALQLYDAGADYVIVPHFLGGEHVSIMLEDVSKDLSTLVNTKINHIKELHRRKEAHPHHA